MSVERLKKIWPEWQIEKQIGKGSFGTVYQVVKEENNVKSMAAIKVISIPLDSSEVVALRADGLDDNASRTYFKGIVDDFVNEIRMMESFKGIQNIVSVEDFKVVEKDTEIGWDIFIRMELLTPFQTYVQGKTFTEKDVIRLGCDICTALEICGQRNIIHRDIKPENIFVNDFGFFKLGDFGIARKMEHMTAGLSQKGTLNYMAPEVFTGTQYDARVDIYSLGIMLYRLLNANRMPFVDSEKKLMDPNARREALERRIQGEALPRPCDASDAMAEVILRSCAFSPADRFATATEMKKALLAVEAGTYQPGAVLAAAASAADDNATRGADGANADMNATRAANGSVDGISLGANVNATRAANTSFDGLNKTQAADNGYVPEAGKKKKAKWPLIVALLLLVAGLGAGGMFLAGKDQEASNQTQDGTPTPEPTEEPDFTETPVPTPTTAEVELIGMPNLHGYTLEDAEALLKAASPELQVVVEEEVYSEEPKGTVISQYPLAESDILKNGTVKLTLSAGPEEVPSVTEEPTVEATSTPTPEPTNTPKPTKTPTPKPTKTPKPEPTKTPKPLPTPTPKPEPTKTPTPKPTKTPTPLPTNTPTPLPTNTPTPLPTNTPTPTPIPIFWTRVEGDVVVISGLIDNETEHIEIPAVLEGCSKIVIAEEAFEWNRNLKSVTMLGNVISIESYAFHGCENLENVIFCNGIESIGKYAFDSCNKLESVILGDGIESIEKCAFYSCKNLKEVVLPEGITKISENMFSFCSSLEEVILPKGITEIAGGAFEGCVSLHTVLIPDGVISIGGCAFYGCGKLDNVVLPDSITYFSGGSVFDGCSSLSNIKLSEQLMEIPRYAFYDCSSLESIWIPSSVKTIGDFAFYNCDKLKQVSISRGIDVNELAAFGIEGTGISRWMIEYYD